MNIGKWKDNWSRKKLLLLALIFVLLVVAVGIFLLFRKDKTTYVYKETKVCQGDLTVGITEDGEVAVGSVEQTFDIDMSAFEASSSSANGSKTTISMFPGMKVGSSSSDSQKSYSRTLDVEEVYVTVGQQIKEGDPLFKLTDNSVTQIEEELVQDEEAAQLALNKLQNEQKQSRLTAEQTKETSEAYAKLAQNEYAVAVAELQKTIDEKQEEIDENVKIYEENTAKLEEKNRQLTAAKHILENAEYAVDNADKTIIYEYTEQEDARDQAKVQVDNLEDEIDALEEENRDLQDGYSGLLLELNQAKRELETGTLEAYKTYQERTITGNDATAQYEATIGYLDADLKKAEDDYEEAKNKLEELKHYIVENIVYAEYSGVVTTVSVNAGDSLSTAKSLITLNNQEDTTITVNLTAAERETIDKESEVKLHIEAYPDTIFEGKIEEIKDAETDSSTGEITYEVIVHIEGEVSGLFEGMTGDVTFITKETREVTYVSNRAIIREGTTSYVKMKDDSGRIIKKEVTTGFSDGVNVEVKEGLSEGDVVLIESKVTQS